MRLRLLLALLVCAAGCSMQLPQVKPPGVDSAAADGALAEFDSNQDGLLSKDEATAVCAGISDSWDRYDQDGDGSVSREELEARFNEWTSSDTVERAREVLSRVGQSPILVRSPLVSPTRRS